MKTENQNPSEEVPAEVDKKIIKDFEEPASVTWMKYQISKFQKLTEKDVSDNMWLIGLKFLLKGIMVLILILMSPFILFVIVFSLLVAG